MSDVFSCTESNSPLLISIPHDGRRLAPGQSEKMTGVGMALPDTDWHVRRLYEFATGLGASILAANYSRYVVDLNRPADDGALYDGQVSTGICPQSTFAGEPIYDDHDALPADEVASRVRDFWYPYHDRLRDLLDMIQAKHGYALLWDAHSIAGEVPRLFDGVLPDLSLGTNDGNSCDPAIAASVAAVAEGSPYSSVLNGRFRGGYITRHYGDPAENVHAIQLELSQRNYMDEKSGDFDEQAAQKLRKTLASMLTTFAESAANR
jgi:N-formylglutamate amidohydrolase